MKQSKLSRFIKSFSRDTDGAVSVEFVVLFPILAWSMMAAYTFFDGYRQSSVNLKAAYTISDLISRETQGINDTYIDSMQTLLSVMTRNPNGAKVRISVIKWNGRRNRHVVRWSEVRGDFGSPLNNSTVVDIEDKLPEMPDQDHVILVETSDFYIPPFQVGITPKSLDNFVFTRPRFTDQVAWTNS
jgi:Flp pilus assembly pilin Flp